jgi:hypothetical protein
MEDFILDTKHDPRARRLAFEWLTRFDATVSERILPQLEDDPSVEFRRDSVTRLIDRAEKLLEAGKGAEAKKRFREALHVARDDDQVRRLAKSLGELGESVDVSRHFGFITRWKLIGPFDHTGTVAFDVVYPPEREIDLSSEYEGKKERVTWRDAATASDYGIVDINKALGRHKGAIAYALAEFTSDRPLEVELRLGSVNAWKAWLNGEFLFGHEEYHHGMQIDQFRVKGEMRKGRNLILVKICQNEQTEEYAQEWKFQLRVCDAAGTAILSTTRSGDEAQREDGEKTEGRGP